MARRHHRRDRETIVSARSRRGGFESDGSHRVRRDLDRRRLRRRTRPLHERAQVLRRRFGRGAAAVRAREFAGSRALTRPRARARVRPTSVPPADVRPRRHRRRRFPLLRGRERSPRPVRLRETSSAHALGCVVPEPREQHAPPRALLTEDGPAVSAVVSAIEHGERRETRTTGWTRRVSHPQRTKHYSRGKFRPGRLAPPPRPRTAPPPVARRRTWTPWEVSPRGGRG